MSDHHHPKSRDILVTGGHGFIGRHVVEELASTGANILSVSQKNSTDVPELPGETIQEDLENPVGLTDALSGIDQVVHLAARAGGIQFQAYRAQSIFSTNRKLTDNLLAACDDAGVERVFLASSLVVYKPSSRPLTEDAPQLGSGEGPNPYAWSKITDEVVAQWYSDIDTVVGRFGNVYGPGAPFDPSRSTVVHALIDRAAQLSDGDDLVVWGDGSATRSFVYVEDAAQGVAVALSRGAPGEAYNIDSGQAVTIRELAEVIRDAVNPTLHLVFDSSKPTGAPYRVGSIEKLASLGYAPEFSLTGGIRKTVEWYRGTRLSTR